MAWWIWLIIILVIVIGIFVALYIVGNKMQKKQSAQKEMMKEQAQPVTMLVIDKKMLPMRDAGLPKIVMEQTPKRYQKAKMPIVKDACTRRSKGYGQRNLHNQRQERQRKGR